MAVESLVSRFFPMGAWRVPTAKVGGGKEEKVGRRFPADLSLFSAGKSCIGLFCRDHMSEIFNKDLESIAEMSAKKHLLYGS